MITITLPEWMVVTYLVIVALKWAIEIVLEYRKASLKHEIDKFSTKKHPAT